MRRSWVVVAVVAAALLAGCSATGSTPTETTQRAGSPTPTGGVDTPTATGTPSDLADVETVVSSATTAMTEAGDYRVRMEQRVQMSGPVSRTQSVRRTTRINRSTREFARQATVSGMGQSVNSSAYLVGQTVYLRSKANVRQYSSKWVKFDVGENFSRYWRNQDALAKQRWVLENATTRRVVGRDTVAGGQAVVVNVTFSPEDYERFLGSQGLGGSAVNVTGHRANFTFWIDRDTDRPLKVRSNVSYTVSMGSRSIRQNVTSTFRYEYGVSVRIRLPEGAESAVNVSDGGSSGRLRTIDP